MSNVSNVTSGSGAFMAYWQSTMQQSRQDYRQLGKALGAGDLAAAQQAFSDLQQVTPGFGALPAAQSSASNTSPAPQDPRAVIKSDVDTLGKALQSGDLTGAQTAFAKLQQDLQASRPGQGHEVGGHHHHHHGHGGKGGAQAISTTPATPPAVSTTPAAGSAASAVSAKQDADGDHDGTRAGSAPSTSSTFYGIDLKG